MKALKFLKEIKNDYNNNKCSNGVVLNSASVNIEAEKITSTNTRCLYVILVVNKNCNLHVNNSEI